MANDDIWILGINMTKFGKHPDKDVVDLASEAALAALADGGVTIKDMGILAAGNLMGAAAGIGQQLQKQIGQTGIPVFNVANACATGATALRTVIMAIKAGECDMGLAVGVEKLSGAGMLGAGFGGAASDEWTPAGRYGAVSGFEGKLGTDMMPGVFAQVGMDKDLEIALELERIALSDDYFIARKLYPNVDFYTGLIYRSMAFPTDFFTVLFAVARTVGWISQWNEMIEDPDQKIGRPRQLYNGQTERPYKPLHLRG